MNTCHEIINVQDWLDGELSPAEAERFLAHMAGCAECEAEATAFRVVFSELRAMPLLDPRPELYERILDEVLPKRLPKWVRVFGWAYGTALAGSLALIGSAFVLPTPSAWLHGVIAAGMRSLTSTGTFVLRSLSEGLAHFGEVLAGGGSAGRMLRVLATALTQPAVLVIILAAVAVCAALLWWMRPCDRRASEELPHVGLLGL